MKHLIGLSALVLAATLAACGGDSTPVKPAFPKPVGTVAVNIAVDDHINKNWKQGELQWKGQLLVDSTTRVLTYDANWSGKFPDGTPGYPALWDDGPYTAGGHEPDGAVAGDNIWGLAAFVATDKAITVSYGMQDSAGDWVWSCPSCSANGGNGKFSVTVGQTADITPPGMAFTVKGGTTDMKLVVDKTKLDVGTWDTTKVEYKGSASAGDSGQTVMTDDGTGKFSVILSSVVGAGKKVDTAKPPYPSLLATGATPEFVFKMNGAEYKVGGAASPVGVTAYTQLAGSTTWTAATIKVHCVTTTSTPAGLPCDGVAGGNNNTYIVSP